jgi:CRP/FNR family cyclic AMP-dependent transcriptional regulator
LPGSDAATQARLTETARLRVVATDERVFAQGGPIPLTLVLRGHGVFVRTTEDGRQLAIGIANPQDLFGFSSIATIATTVDLVALTEIEVAVWRGPDIRQLAATDPGFALEAIDRLAGYANQVTQKLDGFVHQDARRRVVRILARHRDLFFVDPAVLSRSHLPSLVGTSREMTGRVLRELEQEGMLARVGRSRLRLLRPDLLDADAGPLIQDAS